MTTDSPLTAAARAVSTARADLQRIEGRMAELRDKSRDLDELQTAVTQARERRAQVLEQALLDGRKADTNAADASVTKALSALQKREDEITAVNRAIATLESHRRAAQDTLDAALGAFREARGSRVLEFLSTRVEAMGEARALLRHRINQARAALSRIDEAKMPSEARGWWMNQRNHWVAIVDNFQHGVPIFLSSHAPDAAAPSNADAAAAQRLDSDLEEADQLAGAQQPTHLQSEQADQYVDADGNLTSTPPGKQPTADGHQTIKLQDGNAPGMRGAA